MSRTNLEVVASYLEAADLASGIDALAEDVELVFHGQLRKLAGADTVEGKPAAVEWLADWFSRFEPDYRFRIEEARELGAGRVLVVTHHEATGRVSGVPVSLRTANLMTVVGDKIVRQDFLDTPEEAVELAARRPGAGTRPAGD